MHSESGSHGGDTCRHLRGVPFSHHPDVGVSAHCSKSAKTLRHLWRSLATRLMKAGSGEFKPELCHRAVREEIGKLVSNGVCGDSSV